MNERLEGLQDEADDSKGIKLLVVEVIKTALAAGLLPGEIFDLISSTIQKETEDAPPLIFLQEIIPQKGQKKEQAVIRIGDYEIKLASPEWRVFRVLARAQGVPVPRAKIREALDNRESIKNVINRLRRKIETDFSRPEYIYTVHRVGYGLRFVDQSLIDAI